MAIDLVQVLHEKYHPSLAAEKRKDGIFTVFRFKDGGELRVRTAYLKKLFPPFWAWKVFRDIGESVWHREGQLRSKTSAIDLQVVKHSIGNLKILIRSVPVPAPNLNAFKHYPSPRVDLVAKILGKKVRFESPLFELSMPGGHRVIGTQFVQGKHLRSYGENFEAASALAKLLAKLHVNGIAHGHPTWHNFFVRNRQVVLLDPKYLRDFQDIPSIAQVGEKIASAAENGVDERYPIDELPRDPVKNDLAFAIDSMWGREKKVFQDEYLRAYEKEYTKRFSSTFSPRR